MVFTTFILKERDVLGGDEVEITMVSSFGYDLTHFIAHDTPLF